MKERKRRARGHKGGGPKSLNSDKMDLAIKLYDEKKHSVGQICKMMEIPKPTLYKYIKDNKCHVLIGSELNPHLAIFRQ